MSRMSKAVAVLGVVAGLGVAALPLSSYAVEKPATVNVSAEVGDAIEITASETNVTIANVTANASNIAEGISTISVKTSAINGYDVTIKGSAADMALKPNGSGTPAGIPAIAPKVNAAGNTNGWGYKAGNLVASTSSAQIKSGVDYKAVPTSDGTAATLVSASKATGTTADTFDLTFGVTINMGIIPDTYSNSVVLTATTK